MASGSQCGAGPGETPTHMRVFHQADGLCIYPGADRQAMQLVLEQVMSAVLGLSRSDLRWMEEDYPLFEHGLDLDVMLCGKWSSIAGGGVLPAGALSQAGFDPGQVSCFGFGIGLERMAMLKFGIDDIRKLWQPPYIP
jgi:phenylalanyl-tRNA synthetase alpha chain